MEMGFEIKDVLVINPLKPFGWEIQHIHQMFPTKIFGCLKRKWNKALPVSSFTYGRRNRLIFVMMPHFFGKIFHTHRMQRFQLIKTRHFYLLG
jgi:hypothetical protein